MSDPTNILIVDDDEDILSTCQALLRKHFDKIETCKDPYNIPAIMAENEFHVVLLDMNFRPGEDSGKEGLQWLKRILEIDPESVVVMITAFSSINAAIDAMKIGAHDFIEKPWNNEKLISTLAAAAKLRHTQKEAKRFKQHSQILAEDISRRHHPIIGQSNGIMEVLSIIRKVAPTDANVLILGENGTGKELVAHEIHTLSKRAEQPLITVDLNAVPATLLDSELFGHKRGAFTDAREDRIGRFQAANRGTFFLDEIGNLPLALQPKLLHALESREVTPVGGSRPESIDIRLVSATNVSRADLGNPEIFRTDLFHRLNTVEIHLPPLRQRVEDIPLLANTFVREYARKYNRVIEAISDRAMTRLMEYRWPGNVRELRYCIERAIILVTGDVLEIEDFGLLIDPVLQHSTPESENGQTLGDMEKASIELALKKHQGNISLAAKELGLTRPSLYRRIEKFGL
jgi:DNA-binding NtrC family response regulator